ncbi:putative nuclease HARBI1 [Cephus cinctus]|uniref:Nuclease HARBI1 n=1 Tax=Cephus cinctus TaxID=211228 RepID=A0AAJ7BU38_CEPCN|nr:putative nuclease HARBI1 [Cephus cinctus]XP_015593760.1 putative nuclease HARBI1 [Cephus cinctus]XP_024940039.1 putative nuclease HARBI1 [Cephus cinctus]XP_024940040.1 putative nuclease HARBI1 [Cephus cinctus]
MANGYLALDLVALENRFQLLERRVERQALRETQDPFDLTVTEFTERYRLTPELMSNLVDLLAPHLQDTRMTGLSVEKQILSTVRFYATGCFQRPVGEQWGIIMSQPSVSRCIHRVTDAINEHIFRQWIQFPMTMEARQQARQQFQTASQPFDGAIGAIDCTHVAILAPKQGIQICDPNLKILNVNARYPGARHDAYIWSASAARSVMERAYQRGDRKTFLIGDQGYPLEPWLLTPLPHEPVGNPRFRHNEALCSARNCIERLFGVLKSTWRCLSKHRVLQYDPGTAGRIVNVCAVLHNMRINHRLLNDDVLDDVIHEEDDVNHADEYDFHPDANIRPLHVASKIS